MASSVVDASPADPAREITLDERIAAQRAIERVYWRHRVWPTENPSPKPSFEATMPEPVVRAKVLDTLKKSSALGTWWGRGVNHDDLQAELRRMAAETRAPDVLQELFAALGNDPALIAETLGRSGLVDRRIRRAYAEDARFHGAVRRAAERTVATCRDPACLASLGVSLRETVVTLRDGPADRGDEDVTGSSTRVDAEEWERVRARVAAKAGRLEQTDDAFVMATLLSERPGEMVLSIATWPKRTFDSWWSGERERTALELPADAGAFTLPYIDPVACQNDTWKPTHQDIPDARVELTAVWTGAEMIVWGGGEQSGAVNSGGRYDPATDTWTVTSTGAGAPSARMYHSAVWTGDEMIVWGGRSEAPSFQVLNTGGRYDPATDTWRPTSTGPNVPDARYRHSAVWTGSEMIVWGGGASGATVAMNSGGRYDPIADTWTPTSTTAGVPSVRNRHSAVWTGSEMIVWGGMSNFASLIQDGGRYDPATDSWRAMSVGPGAPEGRIEHTTIWTGTEMIIWGGDGVLATALASGGRYDPSTDTWVATSGGANVPMARRRHVAVWTGSEMIVWGGRIPPSSQAVFTNTGARYDPETDAWTPVSIGPSTPTARWAAAAVWSGSEMVVWGGVDNFSSPPPTSGGRYDPADDSWTSTSVATAVPRGGWAPQEVWTGAELIVWGGRDETVTFVSSGARYDPATDSWSPVSQGANAPIYGSKAAWSGTEMVLFGTSANGGAGGRYDPATDSWRPISAPSIATGVYPVWSGREVILWGGGSQGIAGARYNPTTDTWLPTSTEKAPSRREGFIAVWAGTEMIIWGGVSPTKQYLNSGARYDPSVDSWATMSSGASAPAGRSHAAGVWTGSEVIVWGGDYLSGATITFLDTGGRYAPATDSWTATSTGANCPSARAGHATIWTGSEMVAWGGQADGTGGRYNPSTNTWVRTLTAASAPRPRSIPGAFWTGREMIFWGGGLSHFTTTGALYCACPSGRLLYRDADGDGYGDPAIAIPRCDGAGLVGYVGDASDCRDADASVHPGVAESCNGIDDDCSGSIDDDASGEDADGDGVHNACDVCALVYDPAQSDVDHDGDGDACDVDDGVIYVRAGDRDHITWQQEIGPTTWNVYEGDLDVLKSGGEYTQKPASNPLAERHCGVADSSVEDLEAIPIGAVKFALVTGVIGAVEGSLGTASSGAERPNTDPCP